MSNNPRHIVQRYYVPPAPASASGVWNMKEQQQAAYDGIWLPLGVIPTINYLAIGGGGGGGGASVGGTSQFGGGGGAGGLVTGSFGPTYKQPGGFTGYTLTITVGAGGTSSPGSYGTNGGDTTISGQFFNTLGTLTALGGGGGASGNGPNAGNNGGSGGGGGGWNGGSGQYAGISLATQSTSTYGGYGNRGGYGGYTLGSGGGGGAGGQGEDNRILNTSTGVFGTVRYTRNGQGGPGLFVNVAANSSYAGIYGIGGGAVGSSVVGYGSGGGGGFSSLAGGTGNNGVVIFWYNTSFTAPSALTGSYTYSVQNGYRIYVFDYPGGTMTF